MSENALKKFGNLAKSGLGQILTIDQVSRNTAKDSYTLVLKHVQGKPGTARLQKGDGGREILTVPGHYFDKNRIQRGRIDKGVKIFVDMTHGVYLLNEQSLQRLEQNYQRLSASLQPSPEQETAEKPSGSVHGPLIEEKTIITPREPEEEAAPPVASKPVEAAPEKTARPSVAKPAPTDLPIAPPPLELEPLAEEEARQIIVSFNPAEASEWDVRLFFRAIRPRPPQECDREAIKKAKELKRNPDFGKLFSNIPKSEFANAFVTLDVVDLDEFEGSFENMKAADMVRHSQYYVNMIAGRLYQQMPLDQANELLAKSIRPLARKVKEACAKTRKLAPTRRAKKQKEIVRYMERLREICTDFVFKNPKEIHRRIEEMRDNA